MKDKLKAQHNVELQYDLGCVPVIITRRIYRGKQALSLYVGCTRVGSLPLSHTEPRLGSEKKQVYIRFPSSAPSVKKIILDAVNKVRRENKSSTCEQHVEMLKLLLLQPEYQQRLVQAGLIKLPTDAISDLGNEVLISQVEYCNMNETHKAHIYCMCPDEQCSETFQKRFQGNHAFCSRPCTRKYHNRRGGTAGGGGVNSDVIDNPLSGCQNVPLKESGLYSESGACLLSGRLLPLYIGGPCEAMLLTSAKSQCSKDNEKSLRGHKQNPESEHVHLCVFVLPLFCTDTHH